MKIKYLDGDATRPVGGGDIIIAHICNDIGMWGAGFVLAVSKRWPGPEAEYRKKIKNSQHYLGDTQFVSVEPNLTVVNMIAQKGIRSNKNIFPIRYTALSFCLREVNHIAVNSNSTVHMPMIGAGLAGGNWETIEKIIENVLEVQAYVYKFKGGA